MTPRSSRVTRSYGGIHKIVLITIEIIPLLVAVGAFNVVRVGIIVRDRLFLSSLIILKMIDSSVIGSVAIRRS